MRKDELHNERSLDEPRQMADRNASTAALAGIHSVALPMNPVHHQKTEKP